MSFRVFGSVRLTVRGYSQSLKRGQPKLRAVTIDSIDLKLLGFTLQTAQPDNPAPARAGQR
jgi:hypothetical protein